MAVIQISQLHRIVFRKKDSSSASGFSTFVLEPDDLGQDTQMTVNIAPRKKSRSSSLGTSETPIPGTFDAFAGSVTFLADTWSVLGQALGRWTASTYTGADAKAGQMVDDSSSLCAGGDYMSVVCQGICDDGSVADVELTRCIPSMDDDIEIGASDTPEYTLNLNPIVYNSKQHANDGFPTYSYRFGDYDTTKKMRLDASTGAYSEVTA